MNARKQVFEFADLSIKNYKLVSPGATGAPATSVEPVGEGGSGIVFKAIQVLHEDIIIERAIKFFMYRDDIAHLTKHKNNGPISNEDFLTEIRNISKFSHEHLLSVVDAGLYSTPDHKIPYIVTDFVSGPTLRHVLNLDSKKENPKHRDEAERIRAELIENPTTVLDILLKVSSAVEHLHLAGFYHCDIAPKNIFVRHNGGIQPVLGDLGIAKDFSFERDEVFVAGSKAYIPPEAATHLNKEVSWEIFKIFQPRWDLFAFSKTGLELLSLIDERGQTWVKPLVATFSEIVSGDGRQSDISSIIERLEFLQPFHRELAKVPELSPGLTGKRRNLMPVESLSISRRVNKLIKHPALLRLGSVPQITMANQLFPGANHTRYEHSLGVMETTRRYLSALQDQDLFLEHLSVEKIETALICALMFNITRFPLSNVFHEIKSKNKEELGSFSRDNLLEDIECIVNKKGRTLVQEIGRNFSAVSYDCVRNLLLGRKENFDNEDRLIYSFLNCSIDARVVDFVRRDSLHLGIIKGDIFDLDELLPHLTIYDHKLALKLTGVSVAEQVISLRYWLFQRIYWNSPNRVFCAMVRHVILELSEESDFNQEFRRLVLSHSQEELLKFLLKYSNRKGATASADIASRLCRQDQDLYRSILDLGKLDSPDFVAICKKIADMNYRQILDLEIHLESYLRQIFDVKIDAKLILIDVPYEPETSKLGEDIMVIRNDGAPMNLKEFSGIIGGINISFEDHLRRLRVFVHPDWMPRDRGLQIELLQIIRQYLSDHVT